MENVKIVTSFRKPSKRAAVVKNREFNAILIRVKGSADYIFEDRTMHVKEGEMIFVPKGSSYDFKTPRQSENLYTSINFEAENVELPVKIYSLADFHNGKYITESFTELWTFGDEGDRLKCYSLLYEILAHITKTEQIGDAEKRKNSVIEPAVEYLKKNMYDCELKIEKLSALCGISDTYFRKLFVARFNMTPSQYVTAGRLSYAKTVIDSGDYETIREVAELVGYNDALYFGKAFKKFYGYPPSVSV